MENKGVIYILTNPSFPEYVKIGYADDVNKRLAHLNRSECTPFAFRVYATYEVDSRLTDGLEFILCEKGGEPITEENIGELVNNKGSARRKWQTELFS